MKIVMRFFIQHSDNRSSVSELSVSRRFANELSVSQRSVQGWELAHPFSKRIARFLPKNERMSDSLKKTRAICSFSHLW